MRQRLPLALAAATVVALGVGATANAGHECDGLDVDWMYGEQHADH